VRRWTQAQSLRIQAPRGRGSQTSVTAAHCDDHVGLAGHFADQQLGELLAGVEAPLDQQRHDGRVQFVRRLRAGEVHVDATLGLVIKQHACSQAPPCMVRAQEEDGGGIAHDNSLVVSGSSAAEPMW